MIFGYQLPLVLGFGLIATARGWVPSSTALWLCAFFVAWPIFSTLSFPVACLSLAFAPEAWLTPLETLIGVGAYGVLVFLIPSGFLQVSLTRRYRSAFAFWRAIPFVARNIPALSRSLVAFGPDESGGASRAPALARGAWRGAISASCSLFNELLLHAGLVPRDWWLGARSRIRASRPGRTAGGRRAARRRRATPWPCSTCALFSVPLPRVFDCTET